MPVIEPIYSIEKGCEVYHNHSECTERNNIEARNIRAGRGEKRLCKHCQNLASQDHLMTLAAMSNHPLFGKGGSLLEMAAILTGKK